MPGHHIDRRAEDVKRELTALLREVKDPRVQSAFLTLLSLRLSGDAAQCRVYVSAMEGLPAAEAACAALEHASGFLRGELTRRLGLRKAPVLLFEATEAIETGTRIQETLRRLVPQPQTAPEPSQQAQGDDA
jgi:ribosome-binding factor A